MHKFENSWLFQREKIDNLSKNKSIIKKINNSLKISIRLELQIQVQVQAQISDTYQKKLNIKTNLGP